MVNDIESCASRENETPARSARAIAANAFIDVWLERKEAMHKEENRAMRDEDEEEG